MKTFRQILEAIKRSQKYNTYYHVTPSHNVKNIMKVGLIPQVGPSSSKLNEKRGIHLFKDEVSAEDAVTNWMGDEYPENTKLSMLKVRLPKTHPLHYDNFAHVSHIAINANNIRVHRENI